VKKTYLSIDGNTASILCSDGVHKNGGKNHGGAGTLGEDVGNQCRDIGTSVWYYSSVVAIIGTSVEED